MIDSLLAWFSLYGAYVLVGALLVGQTGIPVPTSILLLTVGAMLVDGIASPYVIFSAGLVGAAIGDQIGYGIGRLGGPALADRIHGSRWSHLLERAEQYADKWGAPGVFFSRWLVSPVGPYVNYLAGITGLPWPRFTAMSVAGEAIWIALFLTLGWVFSTSITAVNELIANFTWFAGAAIVALFLGHRLRKAWIKARDRRAPSPDDITETD